jgi:hypothetical protein
MGGLVFDNSDMRVDIDPLHAYQDIHHRIRLTVTPACAG